MDFVLLKQKLDSNDVAGFYNDLKDKMPAPFIYRLIDRYNLDRTQDFESLMRKDIPVCLQTNW